jgi:hypothetical protein
MLKDFSVGVLVEKKVVEDVKIKKDELENI